MNKKKKIVVVDGSGLIGTKNIALNDQTLTPGDNPILGTTHFRDWLASLPKRSETVCA